MATKKPVKGLTRNKKAPVDAAVNGPPTSVPIVNPDDLSTVKAMRDHIFHHLHITKEVRIPEWGLTLVVRSITMSEAVELKQLTQRAQRPVKGGKKKDSVGLDPASKAMMRWFLRHVVLHPETHQPLFTDNAHADKIIEANPYPVGRIVKTARSLNMLSAEDKKEMEEDFLPDAP